MRWDLEAATVSGMLLASTSAHQAASHGGDWVALAVVASALLMLALSLWLLLSDHDFGGSGGSGERRPAPFPPADDEPAWWPEFEREFAVYVATVGNRAARRASLP
jgi:hypothetical protein